MAAPTRLVDVVSALAVALALGTGCPGRDRPGDDDDDDPAIDAGPSDAGINDAGIEPDAGFAFDAGPIPAGTRVRVVAGNLTTGNFEAWDLGHGARILQGLAPDVAGEARKRVGCPTTRDPRPAPLQYRSSQCAYGAGSVHEARSTPSSLAAA